LIHSFSLCWFFVCFKVTLTFKT